MPDIPTYLAASPLPALDGPHAVAERLILAVHRGVNWDVWGPRRMTYWDGLTSRVVAATYAGPSLTDWWQDLCQRIESTPRTSGDRHQIAADLATTDGRAVLAVLRKDAAVLVLRVRVAIEHHRDEAALTPSTAGALA